MYSSKAQPGGYVVCFLNKWLMTDRPLTFAMTFHWDSRAALLLSSLLFCGCVLCHQSNRTTPSSQPSSQGQCFFHFPVWLWDHAISPPLPHSLSVGGTVDWSGIQLDGPMAIMETPYKKSALPLPFFLTLTWLKHDILIQFIHLFWYRSWAFKDRSSNTQNTSNDLIFKIWQTFIQVDQPVLHLHSPRVGYVTSSSLLRRLI